MEILCYLGIVAKITAGGYAFVISGDGSWDEGIKLIPRNGTASEDFFEYTVALYGDRSLIGGHFRYERGDASGVAYIFIG